MQEQLSCPFPGMDPWLEHPSLWGDVHFRLIAALASYLSPLSPPLDETDVVWVSQILQTIMLQ